MGSTQAIKKDVPTQRPTGLQKSSAFKLTQEEVTREVLNSFKLTQEEVTREALKSSRLSKALGGQRLTSAQTPSESNSFFSCEDGYSDCHTRHASIPTTQRFHYQKR